MAEIEITLPTVQYGNVKVKATPEELGLDSVADATALGIGAAIYLNLFTQGFKTGSQMDVKAPSGAEQSASVPEAQRLLDEGLGGVTELPDGTEDRSHEERPDPEDVDSDPAAPWSKTPAVDSKPKPWEAGETAPKAVVSDEW